MTKTIKVIDLLNKIANGEEMPIEIEFNCKRYIFNKHCNQYYEKGKGSYFNDKLKFEDTIEWDFYGDYLNAEVEIIEEQQDIDIQTIKKLEYLEDYEVDKTDVRLNRELINKILQWAKQLDKNIKDKE